MIVEVDDYHDDDDDDDDNLKVGNVFTSNVLSFDCR